MQDLENVSASCTILTNSGGCHAHVHWKLFDSIIVQRTAIILVLVASYMNCACNIFVSYRLFNSFYVRGFGDFFRDVAINVNVNFVVFKFYTKFDKLPLKTEKIYIISVNSIYCIIQSTFRP